MSVYQVNAVDVIDKEHLEVLADSSNANTTLYLSPIFVEKLSME